MKKIFKISAVLVMTLVMVMSSVPSPTKAATDDVIYDSLGMKYKELEDGNLELVKGCYKDDVTEIVIPDYVDGKKVVSIGNSAFREHCDLTKVTIPDGVTNIGKYAFSECSSLEKVNIPDGVTIINAYCFDRCSKLQKINIPYGVKRIEDSAFNWCHSLSNITFPDSVTYIGNDAFNVCGFSTLTLPTTLEFLGGGAFGMCGIKEVVIPGSVKKMSGGTFYNCPNLTKVTILEGVEYVTGFKDCSNLKEVNMPQSTKVIDNSAFWDCNGLETIHIPDGVTSINRNAFRMCEALKDINMPKSLVSIGKEAFYDCKKLTEIKLPKQMNDIGEGAFWGCNELKKINIPNGLTKIEDATFVACSLEDIQIPPSVKTIGRFAFHCNGLNKVTIPAQVEQIDDEAFSGKDAIFYVYEDTEGERYAVDNQRNYYLIDGLITEVELSEKALTLEKGESREITATFEPVLTKHDKTLTWTSDDTKVATVNDGVVTAVDAGDTTIRATSTNGVEATVSVHINAPKVIVTPVKKINYNSNILKTGTSISWKKNVLNVKWSDVKNADGYDVYVSPCNKKFNGITKSVKAGTHSIKIKKLNKKKLNNKSYCKVYVNAYKYINGKKTYIDKSMVLHAAAGKAKNTNVKKFNVAKEYFVLKKGSKGKIKVSAVKQNKKKKLLPKIHGKNIKYYSDNKEVATVSSNGTITAKGKGQCYVYVLALNGVKKKIFVSVK